MAGLKKANINMNRKMLADLAVNDSKAFTQCMICLLDKRNYKIESKPRKEIQAKEQAFYNKYVDEIQKLVKGFTDDNGKYMFDDGKKGSHKIKGYILDNEWVIFFSIIYRYYYTYFWHAILFTINTIK